MRDLLLVPFQLVDPGKSRGVGTARKIADKLTAVLGKVHSSESQEGICYTDPDKAYRKAEFRSKTINSPLGKQPPLVHLCPSGHI